MIDRLLRVIQYITVGVRLQLYGFGKDRLALTVLYYQGLQDMLEMDVHYTVNDNDTFRNRARARGSGLSITLSHPLRLFIFDKQERALRRGQKSS